MKQVEGESGKIYLSVRIPDSTLGFTDKILATDNDWKTYLDRSEERITSHFGEEAKEWMGRIRGYMTEGWLRKETVSLILGNIFHYMEENEL